jgi:hypothetical protein
MLKRLQRLFGMVPEFASPSTKYDPIYGLPKWAVQEWLARNPPLREEYEAAVRQKKVALRTGNDTLPRRR